MSMKGWTKLGSLFDKKNEKKEDQSGGNKPKAGLLDRLSSMVQSVERRIREAFESGKASRRFSSAEVLVLPPNSLEEVREVQIPKKAPLSVGRFEYISSTSFRLGDFDEVVGPTPQVIELENSFNARFSRKQ